MKRVLLLLGILLLFGCDSRIEPSRNLTVKIDNHSQIKNKVFNFTTTKDIDACPQIIDIVTNAYSDLGYKINIHRLPGKRAIIESISNTKIDGELVRSNLIENTMDNLVKVPVPLYSAKCVIYARNTSKQLTSKEELKNLKVATVLGYNTIENEMGEIEHIQIPDAISAFKMLLEGRIDCLVTIDLLGDFIIAKLALHEVKKMDLILLESELYHYINKRHEQIIPSLVKAISKYSGKPIEIDLKVSEIR